MNLIKPLTALAIFSICFITVAFTSVDCYAQLTLNINSSIGHYYIDVHDCAENSDTYDDCLVDAGISLDNNIDNALAIHDKCCCENQQPCCDP